MRLFRQRDRHPKMEPTTKTLPSIYDHPMASASSSNIATTNPNKEATPPSPGPQAPYTTFVVHFARKRNQVIDVPPLAESTSKENLYYGAEESIRFRDLFMQDAKKVAQRSRCLSDNALYHTFMECSKAEGDISPHLVEQLRTYIQEKDTSRPQQQQEQEPEQTNDNEIHYTGLERMAARPIYADKSFRTETILEAVRNIQRRHQGQSWSNYDRQSAALRFACEAVSFCSVLFAHQLACAALEKDEYDRIMGNPISSDPQDEDDEVNEHNDDNDDNENKAKATTDYALDLGSGDNDESDGESTNTSASSLYSEASSLSASSTKPLHLFPSREELYACDDSDSESEYDDDDYSDSEEEDDYDDLDSGEEDEVDDLDREEEEYEDDDEEEDDDDDYGLERSEEEDDDDDYLDDSEEESSSSDDDDDESGSDEEEECSDDAFAALTAKMLSKRSKQDCPPYRSVGSEITQ